MKIYIAGKITGDPDYKRKFAQAEMLLSESEHIAMNPAILPEGFPWESYMPICYAMIDACDAIYLLQGWEESKGARLERTYAKAHDKLITYQPIRDGE